MRDDYGYPICCNDVRRRPDLPSAKRHEVWRLSGVVLLGHENEKEILLCIDCRSWVNEKGDFVQTIWMNLKL